MPSRAAGAAASASALLLHVAQAGGRLVEQQQRRVGAQRARDLDERCWPSARVPASSCSWSPRPTRSSWRAASASSCALLGAVEPQHRAPARPCGRAGARRARRSPAPSCRGSACTCWKVRAMPEPRDLARRQRRRSCCAAEPRPRRASSGSTPVIRLKVVDLPAPLGPIRPTISPARTWKLTSLTATRPPNSLRTACTSSSSSPRRPAWRARAGPAHRPSRTGARRARQPALDEVPEAVGRVLAASSPAAMPNTITS